MRHHLLLPALLIAASLQAQYGTFDPKAVNAAKATSTIVFLDNGDSPYNRAVMDAVKAHWTLTKEPSFRPIADLATMPADPTKTYLIKTQRTDAEKHTATFLTLVQGWKPKKGDVFDVADNSLRNMPPGQELASIMVDPVAVSGDGSAMLHIYVKNLQDYLKQVEAGKIKDKATADRLYGSRNRLVKDMDLWVARPQLDKSLADVAGIKQTYTRKLQLMDHGQQMAAAAKGEAGVALADAVITGEYKTKWCFRRVFNAKTGELMYLRDEAALHDKKLGFISEDFRILEQSR